MRTSLASGERLAELFQTFTTQAWRWECQGTYRQPAEAEAWRRWRAGESDDLAWLRPWLRQVQEATRGGRGFARVRVFGEPPTEYQRWQIDLSPENIAAGEDMRVLTASQAGALALPDQDFWLFDDECVALMYFEDEQFAGIEIITEPGEVDRYRRWKALAWHDAVSFHSYVHQHPQRSP